MTMMLCQDDPCCQRKRRPLDDPFFEPGDRLVFGSAKGDSALTYFYWEESPLLENGDAVMGNSETEPNDDMVKTTATYPCPACLAIFTSLQECDDHYEATHIMECRVCSSILPSAYLLDLHLQEAHDSYFAAAVERKCATYKCLIQECSCSNGGFKSVQERLNHLQNEHGFPKWFRFVPKRCIKENRNSTKEDNKKKNWLKNRQHHSDIIQSKKDGQTGQAGSDDSSFMDIENRIEHESKRRKRREKQMQKRAQVPCRFFSTKEGCWRGDSCMFLHETSSTMDDEAKLKGLVKDMEKAQISVPHRISFGRRRNG